MHLKSKDLKPSCRRGYGPIFQTGMDCDLDLHLEPFLNILKRPALKKDVEQTFKCHPLNLIPIMGTDCAWSKADISMVPKQRNTEIISKQYKINKKPIRSP